MCDTEGQLNERFSGQIFRGSGRLTAVFIAIVSFIYVRHAFIKVLTVFKLTFIVVHMNKIE